MDIIAHSMGGLVARAYVQFDYENRNDVDQLIMLGTPNYGSSDVYTLWEGGEIPNNWDSAQRTGIWLYMKILQARHPEFPELTLGNIIRGPLAVAFSTTPTPHEIIHDHVTSIQDLFPAYGFIVSLDTGPLDVEDMIEQTGIIGDLNVNSPTTGIPALLSRVTVTNIAGTGKNTVGTIPVREYTGTDGL